MGHVRGNEQSSSRDGSSAADRGQALALLLGLTPVHLRTGLGPSCGSPSSSVG